MLNAFLHPSVVKIDDKDIFCDTLKKKGKEKEIKEKEEKEKIKFIYFQKPQKNIEYYYNQIKEKLGLKTINYYQFFSFVNILFNQLKIFTKNE